MKQSEVLTSRDAVFHQPAYRVPSWLETNWFSFMNPEERLRGHIRVIFRTNLGVVAATVMIWTGESPSLVEMDYTDIRMHLPIPPQNLDHYRLENGLEVTMIDPLQHYRVTYEGEHGTRIEFDAHGIMPALDSSETRLPTGAEFSHFHSIDPRVSGPIGHIDQTMKVSGTVTLRGREIRIDHPSNRDHSWSPRPERAHGRGYFDCGYFGEDFGFHVQTRQGESGRDGEVTNGYIYEKGEAFRLRAGLARYQMDRWRTLGLDYELEDERGRTHRFHGTPEGGMAVPFGEPNAYCNGGLVRWEYEGETGWGDFLWHWEVKEMQRLRIEGRVSEANE